MPPRKISAAASKASTATPRPRGRPAAKKVFKSSEFVDDEAEEAVDVSDDDDMRSVKSTTSTKEISRHRPVVGRAKSVVGSSDDDDDAASIKSRASTNPRPRPRPRSVTKSKSTERTVDDNSIEISSGDDAMSIKSAKSTKSAMSVDDDEWGTTPPRRSRSVVPKTPVSSRTSSVNRKRSASLMVSPITDEESSEMMPSPTKSVRFLKDTVPSMPLKGVLKKPEVVIPVKSRASMSISKGWDDEDVFTNTPTPGYPPSSKTASVPGNSHDGDDSGLWSPFEEDRDEGKVTPKKRSSKGKEASRVSSDGQDDVYLEDFDTSAGPPVKDETDIGNRDPMLKNTYRGLPKLRAACVVSWSHKPAHLPTYSGTLEELPHINKKLIYDAITFSGVGGFRNLSRSDPAKISIGFGGQAYFHAVGGSGPLTFVSTVRTGECYVVDPKVHVSNGKLQKLIEGALIEGEWERLVGAIGHVIDKVEYRAQIQAGYVAFSTAFAASEPVTPSPSNASGMRRVSGPNPFTRGPSSGNVTLSCHDILPIYDGRKDERSLYELLPDVHQLPRINRELPFGSCAVIAYTINTWGTSLPINVSFNVKWVLLLGAGRP